jgi:hypothetical protein
MADILKLGSIETLVPKTEEPFVVSEKIVVNTWDKNRPRIVDISASFLVWFKGQVEEPKLEIVLQHHKLLRDSTDRNIIDGVGGEVLARLFLSSLYFMLDRQKWGNSGQLVTKDAEFNIFYLADFSGNLRTVSASWDNGWSIGACEIDTPALWQRSARVFSRRPAFKYTIPKEVLEESSLDPPVPAA